MKTLACIPVHGRLPLVTLTIGVTYYPREVETISATMQTWSGADFIIYPDGCRFDFETRHPVRLLGNRAGCFRHYYRVLADLYATTDTEYIGVIPDDVVLSDDFAQKCMEGANGSGYAAGYTPTGMSKISTLVRLGNGWIPVKGGWGKSYGGCYVYPREVVKRILSHPYIINHRDNYAPNKQIDAAIPELMHRLGLRQVMHVPSLSDHIGATSTIGHKTTIMEKGYLFTTFAPA